MYTPYLNRSLVDARIGDLRHSMATSRGRRSTAGTQFDRGRHEPHRGAPTNPIRALVARFAH